MSCYFGGTFVGAFDWSERYLRKYMRQEPEPNAPSSRALAFSPWLTRRPDEGRAVKEIQTAVQMEPSFEPAQKDLKRLK